MKFRAERSEFEDAIKWVQRTVGDRASFPVMAGIRMSLSGDALTLSSTNGQIDSEMTLPVSGSRDGAALVSGRLLPQVVHLLPKDAVEISSDGDKLEITCGRASFDLRLMILEDFPTFRTMDAAAQSGVLKAGEFSQLITQVARSASNEDARQILTGVRLQASGGTFTAAATDSYRLAVRSIPWDHDGDMSALVPRKALEQAKHAADLLGSDVRLTLGDTYASFTYSDRRLISTLIEGTYPDYAKLLPEDWARRIRVNRLALTEVVRRISVVGQYDKSMTPVILGISADTLTVRADSSEAGRAVESLPIELEGEPLDEIAFNPTFLIDGLDSMGGEEVHLEFRDAMKPAVMRVPEPEQGDDAADRDFLYLLMPVRV